MINVDEVCAQIYEEVNGILAKNKTETKFGRDFTKREIESYLADLHKKKQIVINPTVNLEDTEIGLKVCLYDRNGDKIESIEQIVSLAEYIQATK